MTEQPSEVLRRAAKVLREHADAATDGPWENVAYDVYETHSAHGDVVAEAGLAPADARYVALMHPPVGLALADWLDAEAIVLDGVVPMVELVNASVRMSDDRAVVITAGRAEGEVIVRGDSTQHALAVARAILREADDGA